MDLTFWHVVVALVLVQCMLLYFSRNVCKTSQGEQWFHGCSNSFALFNFIVCVAVLGIVIRQAWPGLRLSLPASGYYPAIV